jgi:hypothetical protein
MMNGTHIMQKVLLFRDDFHSDAIDSLEQWLHIKTKDTPPEAAEYISDPIIAMLTDAGWGYLSSGPSGIGDLIGHFFLHMRNRYVVEIIPSGPSISWIVRDLEEKNIVKKGRIELQRGYSRGIDIKQMQRTKGFQELRRALFSNL